MLDFSGHDEKAKLVAAYYAKQFNEARVLEIINHACKVENNEDAILLGRFFWKMLDTSAADTENGTIVLDETNLRFWMERLMNIIGGYLVSAGYENEWDTVCDEA